MPSDDGISDGRNDARNLDDARVAEWEGEDGRWRSGGWKALAENDDGAENGRNSVVAVVVRMTARRNAMRMRVAIVCFVGDQD